MNELPRANFPGKCAESTNKTLLVYYKTAYSTSGGLQGVSQSQQYPLVKVRKQS